MPEDRREQWVGLWQRGDEGPAEVLDLPAWAQARSIDTVVWTALPTRFGGEEGRIASETEIVEHLSGLRGALRDEAERYIRHAPPQTDTPYRRAIEAALGWTRSTREK
jgi:hypothetical protein